jgi:hypothetical protein
MWWTGHENKTGNSLVPLYIRLLFLRLFLILGGKFLLLDDVCLQNFDLFHWPVFLVCLDQAKLLH